MEKQLLKIKTVDVCGQSYHLENIFTEEFLIPRPLLMALRSKEKTVLPNLKTADRPVKRNREVIKKFPIQHQTKIQNHSKLVLLTDVSGSMDFYSTFW